MIKELIEVHQIKVSIKKNVGMCYLYRCNDACIAYQAKRVEFNTSRFVNLSLCRLVKNS